jgi:CubicO group peptidase (beta-lactamase class C family)
MKQFFTTLLVVVLLSSTTRAQTRKESDTIQKVNDYLLQMEKAGFSGSVLVAIRDEKKISKGFGYSDKEKRIKNTPETIFDIGSITKQFTAAAILKLEMQGKLKTDDRINKYFDNVPEDKKNITIHDLLRHQSGLTSNVGKDFERIGETDFLDKVFTSKLRTEPGTNFYYSNIGYSLLAMIVERVTNQSYESYLYENLWKPAQMEQTGYSRPVFASERIAVGYYMNDSIWGKPSEMEWDSIAPYWHLKGNGGILSTTEDMYKWHQALSGDKILSKETKQKLFHPKLRHDESEESYYAYGWDVSKTHRNTTQIWHSGTNHIVYADFLSFPDEGLTLIMLSNKYHPHFNMLNLEISRIILNPDYKPEIPFIDNKENRDFTKRIIKTLQESGLENAKASYKSKHDSEQLLEYMMRQEGFDHIDNGKPDTAIRIFEMNAFVYPQSAKALQGLAEGYMETGKNEPALRYFKESLRLNPESRFVKNMIRDLEGK